MKKKLLTGLVTGLFVVGLTGMASAVPYQFTEITSNSPINLSSQLSVDVTSGTGADAGLTLFKFTNTGILASAITDIYFDWGAGSALTYVKDIESADVSFDPFAMPPDLPGGNPISFTADWSTDSEPPAQPNGVNNFTGTGSQEYLTLAFSGDFNSIITSLDNGTYRIGLHVQGLSDDGSESYVNTPPVPEPATMMLFGSGLAGLAGMVRRKSRKAEK